MRVQVWTNRRTDLDQGEPTVMPIDDPRSDLHVHGGTLSRRGVLAAGAVLAGGAALAMTAPADRAEATALPTRKPKALKAGDVVRVVAPAGKPTPALLARGIEILQSWGLVVQTAPHVFDDYGYLAGKDADRLADLNAALADPAVRGVFAARGGYGVQRIVDGVNIAAVRRDPKVVVGFSDLTSLQGRLWQAARLATIHGPMVNWSDSRTGPESAEALRKAVMTTDPVVINREPTESTAPLLVPGKATGLLLGGNLTLLDAAIGTPDFPALSGAILFFEETDEAPYRLDRMLTHLGRTGSLRRVAGIAVGQVINSVPAPGAWDAVGAIKDRIGDLGVPVLGGLRLGHGNGQLTIPLGVPATIDTEAGTLTIDPAVV
jgi:muramoyltetrapeptide carboxypeptidase